MTREQKQEFTLRISQANSTQMVVILYDMLLTYVDECEACLTMSEYEKLKRSAELARGCLKELLHSLNMKYDPAPALASLYHFCMRSLSSAVAGQSVEPLSEVRRVIAPLREAYDRIAPEDSAGPVMGNSQTIYAGLTYGRNSLTENMSDQGANRGMYV